MYRNREIIRWEDLDGWWFVDMLPDPDKKAIKAGNLTIFFRLERSTGN
jgi:hypothetical protein